MKDEFFIEERNKKMTELYLKGERVDIIAKEVGLSERGVRYVLKKIGVQMRSVGQPRKPKKPQREPVSEIPNSEWRAIKGYEGIYEISDKGQVRSIERVNHNGFRFKERILRNRKVNGYPSVLLSKNGIEKQHTVHRLIAEAFIPNPENKPEVNHIDGNKWNSVLNNLEWVTRSENVNHAYKTGLNSKGKGTRGKKKQKEINHDNRSKRNIHDTSPIM